MKTLFYCQHSLGVGHLMRVLQLAEAFLRLGQVCVISGGKIPESLAINPDIRLEKLPPLDMNTGGQLENNHSGADPQAVLDRRRDRVVKIAQEYRPDTLIVEMFPFGRKKFRDEITLLIQQVRGEPLTQVLCSVRDILVTARSDQARFDQRAARWLNEYFDAVLVHADSRFVRLEETFSAHGDIGIPVHYTGYVSRPAPAQPAEREQRIVVSAGGGRVGHQLLEVAAHSFARLKAEVSLDMLIIAGPFAKDGFLDSIKCPGLSIVPYVENLPHVLAASQVSISQCGYNTFTDIIRADIPAILVPFEAEQENEQYRRAKLLQECGRATVLRESELTTDRLVQAVDQIRDADTSCRIDLNGAAESRRIVHELYANG